MCKPINLALRSPGQLMFLSWWTPARIFPMPCGSQYKPIYSRPVRFISAIRNGRIIAVVSTASALRESWVVRRSSPTRLTQRRTISGASVPCRKKSRDGRAVPVRVAEHRVRRRIECDCAGLCDKIIRSALASLTGGVGAARRSPTPINFWRVRSMSFNKTLNRFS